MINRSYNIYLRNVPQPICFEDESTQPDLEVKQELQKLFISKEIHVFETGDDITVLRPSEVSAIFVSKLLENANVKKQPTSTKNKKELVVTEDNLDK